MLRAEFGVVPYMFRDDGLKRALEWCETPDRFSIRYIEAAGGAGKTRFAIELCRRVALKGWITGMLPREPRGVSSVPLPRLIAVDYVEESGALDLVTELSSLCNSANQMSPVRVLLLSRPTRGAGLHAAIDAVAQQPLAVGALLRALEKSVELADPVSALTTDQRSVLFAEALPRFGHGAAGETWRPTDQESPDLSDDHFAQPLDVLFEAFDTALTDHGGHDGTRPAVERVLNHEERYWRTGSAPVGGDLARRCVAFATLAGARDNAEARALLSLVPEVGKGPARRAVDIWLAALYPGDDHWNPLKPDRLGEVLIAQSLREESLRFKHVVRKILRLRSDRQVERALEVLARLTIDKVWANDLRPPLIARYGTLARRCQRQTRGSKDRVGATGLLDGLVRLHLAVIGNGDLPRLTVREMDALAAGLDMVRGLAGQFARSKDAAVLTTQYHDLCQRRVDQDPGNLVYRSDLANSYDNLGVLHAEAGRTTEAETYYYHSLKTRRELANLHPDNQAYQFALSDSYNRLGDLAVQKEDYDDARDNYHEALRIAEAIVGAHPTGSIYGHELSNCYNNLGDLAFKEGRNDEARRRYNQALDIALRLIDRDAENSIYQRDLSNAYNNLGDLAVNDDRPDDAKEPYLKALAIALSLSPREPGNSVYQIDLWNSYNNLGDLAVELHEWPDAGNRYRQALRIVEDLVEHEPESTPCQRNISVSYQNLGDLAARTDHLTEAGDHYRTVLRIAVNLASEEPKNATLQRDLIDAYSKLGELAMSSSEVPDAQAYYRRAYEVARDLTASEPDNLPARRDLMTCVLRLGDISLREGRHREAARQYRKGLHIARRLVTQEPDSAMRQRDLSEAYERVMRANRHREVRAVS
ncbi:tetratricopeptide repeat protein [Kribbella sp. NPDC050241]|uniref:tetratricopeptide repeat protein n=1 Tax=Kribbella sp. NPDC050241 TaxID=3364115 RepID=UPI003796A234